MTYHIGRENVAAQTRAIELSLSSDQVLNQGDVIPFDTITASHVDHGVGLSSGVITLDQTRSYWLQASFDITRASATSSIKVSFYGPSNALLTAADGAGFAQWQWFDSSGAVYGKPNATFTATYVSSDNHATGLTLRPDILANGSTINAVGTKIIILEAEVNQ